MLPWANGALEAPAFTVGRRPCPRASPTCWFVPSTLGWHTKRADVTAGFQFYAPTGTYERGGSENVGRGMWTYEPFVGATFYFDEKRTVSAATTAFWEFHGDKKDTTTKVGQILTLQGGVGKSYLGGGLILGAAYYAQWKVTKDELAVFILPDGTGFVVDVPGKHRVYGFGPDVTLPIASKSKLFHSSTSVTSGKLVRA